MNVFVLISTADTHREMLLESYLKSVYQQETHHSETDWPPTLDVEYVNLVLIRQERIESVSHHQEIVELSKRGQIQDILDHDKFHKLSLADITSYSAHRKVIVIEGAPGVGKTTLAHKLCHDWALKQLLGEFLLVLYIPLRVPLVRVAESLEDLLKYFGDNCTYADAQCIKESQGDKVLFVLDGWDELGPACRLKNVFFPKLIRGELLPECSVLVTSRPVAMDDIRQYANRLIQIIGFTEEQIHQYIYSYFKSITHIAVKLIEDLEQYPNVSSTCYIGINLTIVCYVYIACDYQLPSTLSEVYEQFIFHTIKRHFKRLSESQIDSKLSCVVTVNEFDGNVKEVLKNLGKLALEGLQKDEFSFSRDKLKEVCHIDESEAQFDGFGLLKLLHILRKHGTETYYHFLHLTVQEYLAAYSIAQMGEREQGDILESALIARDSSYEMVLKFFCGIDRFKSRPACFIFSQPNVVGVPIVLECIFEGQWEHGCQKVAKHTSRSFSIRHDIQPYRSLVIGYVMAKSGTTWELNMIGDRELKGMSQFILTVPTTLKRISILKASLTTESTKYLAEIIQSQVLLSELILSESHLNDDVVNTLCKALCIHKRLEILELTNNDLTSTSITTISDLVSQLPVLQRLDLGRNELSETTCKDILLAASASTSLREFCLPCASEELTKEAHALNITRLERGLHELTLIVPQHSFKN